MDRYGDNETFHDSIIPFALPVSFSMHPVVEETAALAFPSNHHSSPDPSCVMDVPYSIVQGPSQNQFETVQHNYQYSQYSHDNHQAALIQGLLTESPSAYSQDTASQSSCDPRRFVDSAHSSMTSATSEGWQFIDNSPNEINTPLMNDASFMSERYGSQLYPSTDFFFFDETWPSLAVQSSTVYDVSNAAIFYTDEDAVSAFRSRSMSQQTDGATYYPPFWDPMLSISDGDSLDSYAMNSTPGPPISASVDCFFGLRGLSPSPSMALQLGHAKNRNWTPRP